MKNLFGAAAPTNRVLGSFKFLMLIVLVAIGFTSCKDQSKKEVLPETELIAKSNLLDVQSNFDTGGNKGLNGELIQTSVFDYDTGGKNSTGGMEKQGTSVCDTGGKGDRGTTEQFSAIETGGAKKTSNDYFVFDTGGSKGKGTSTTGEYFVFETGGGKSTTTGM